MKVVVHLTAIFLVTAMSLPPHGKMIETADGFRTVRDLAKSGSAGWTAPKTMPSTGNQIAIETSEAAALAYLQAESAAITPKPQA
ncbi:MAG: hypothetical protein LBE78_10815 [Burkholderiaceae bacterium]|jgi:hypothetical protein|nr:hypothetical protein [Burkholderiaceae bacterium]